MLSLRSIAQATICILSLNAGLALAQRPDSAARCVAQPGRLHASQQATTDMFAVLVPAGDSTDAPAMYLATLLQEVQLAFTPPDTLTKVSDGLMSAWLHADGRLTNPRAADTLLPPALARALAAAMDSVSRTGGVGPVLPEMRTDSVEMRLIVHYADQRTPLSIPILRVVVPPAYFEFQVEKPVLAKPDNPPPRYPAHLRARSVHGEVVAQFVVDTTGRAEMRTFKVLEASHEDFVKAVRDVVPRMRFTPAEIAGCKVRQIVQLPFTFWTVR